MMMDVDVNRLVREAAATASNAYCPYSGFKVGAALAITPGASAPGVNMENASYGLTVCAERNAFASAISGGLRRFKAIAIVSSGKIPPLPCGAAHGIGN